MPAAKKKVVAEPVVDEPVVEPEPEAAGLPGTPVVADTEYAPLGVAVPDLGPPADDAEPAEGDAKNDPRTPLDPTPPGDFRLDNEA